MNALSTSYVMTSACVFRLTTEYSVYAQAAPLNHVRMYRELDE